MKTAKIDKIYKLNIWVERDFCGSNHIMMQHEDFGEPFLYASLHYNYAYTSSSTIHLMTEKFMEMLGVGKEEIVWKSKEMPKFPWWLKVIYPIYDLYFKFKFRAILKKASEK